MAEGPEKSISKKDFQVKKFIFSSLAPRNTFAGFSAISGSI